MIESETLKVTTPTAREISSREARDAVLRGGMEHGLAAVYDRLAELLGEVQC